MVSMPDADVKAEPTPLPGSLPQAPVLPEAVPEAAPLVIEGTKGGRQGDVTQKIGVEANLLLHIQDNLLSYFTEISKGSLKKGQLHIYRVDRSFAMRWRSEDSKSEKIAPEGGKLLATINIKGDLTQDPNAFEVLRNPAAKDNESYKRTLDTIREAMIKAIQLYTKSPAK